MNDGGFGPWIEGLIMAEEHDRNMLEPCPFCGADDANLSVREDEDGEPYIYCHVCKSVYYGDQSQNIIEMWNRRAKE